MPGANSNTIHLRAILWAVLLTTFISTTSARACEATNANLTKILEDHNLPALGASYDAGFSGYKQAQVGVHKTGTDIAAEASDLWHVGSNTKAMVATVVGLLVQDGRLSWETRLEKVFDRNSSGIVLSEDHANITIGLLSSHTAGLSDAAVFGDADLLLSMYDVSAAAGRLFYSNISLSSPASHRQGVWEYANMNYIILGLVVDVVAGVPAEAHMESRLFKPLNITSIGWGPLPEPFATSATNPYPHYANGTLGLAGPPIPYPADQPFDSRDYPPVFHTAGMAHMTLEDYNKWLRLHVDEETQTRVNVSRQTLGILHQAHPETNESSQGYGYTYGGWFRSDVSVGDGDGYLLGHVGSNLANYMTATVDTARNITVAATTNVGGPIVGGAAWIQGTHLVTDSLLTGDLVMEC